MISSESLSDWTDHGTMVYLSEELLIWPSIFMHSSLLFCTDGMECFKIAFSTTANVIHFLFSGSTVSAVACLEQDFETRFSQLNRKQRYVEVNNAFAMNIFVIVIDMPVTMVRSNLLRLNRATNKLIRHCSGAYFHLCSWIFTLNV